jgi:hypothetical protein
VRCRQKPTDPITVVDGEVSVEMQEDRK